MLSFHPAAASKASVGADCLVVAVSSCGNVGQLAVDLMVASTTTSAAASNSTTNAELLGWLDSSNHVPMVGHEVFNRSRSAQQQPQLCLPLELYGLGTAGSDSGRFPVALLQTRAPLLRGHASAFAKELVAWVKAQGTFGRVVLVAGAAPTDEEVLDPGARLWFTANAHAQGGPAAEDAKVWAGRFFAQDIATLPALQHQQQPHVAHTGIASQLLRASEQEGLPASALYYFAAEGDNAEDSARVAHVLLESLLPSSGENGPLPLVAPRSWECLFGRRRPETEAF